MVFIFCPAKLYISLVLPVSVASMLLMPVVVPLKQKPLAAGSALFGTAR